MNNKKYYLFDGNNLSLLENKKRMKGRFLMTSKDVLLGMVKKQTKTNYGI